MKKLFLVLALFLGVATTKSQTIIASGNCGAEGDGSNLQWILTSDSVLTISGSGKMQDFPWRHWSEDTIDAWKPYKKQMKSLVMENSITSIGNYAFYFCDCFTNNLTIPNSVRSIGKNTFSGCSGFTGALTIPNSVRSIGNSAFSYCSGFTGSLTISNSLTSIGHSAFYYCSGFTGTLIIPNSVTLIEEFAFSDCSGFTGALTIPNSVTLIEDFAFQKCGSFTGALIIPNSVRSIGYSAFHSCSGFDSIYSYSVRPVVCGSKSVFSGIDKSIPVYVPCGSISGYQNADVWGEFTNYHVIDGLVPGSKEVIITAKNNILTVSWNGFVGTEFQITRTNDNNTEKFVINVTDTFYIDSNVVCGVNYCYDVKTIECGYSDSDITCGTVNIEQNAEIGAKISLYPNPATSEITIESKELKINSVEICDLSGRSVLTLKKPTDKISVSLLPTGIYLINISTNAGTTVKKFVKK